MLDSLKGNPAKVSRHMCHCMHHSHDPVVGLIMSVYVLVVRPWFQSTLASCVFITLQGSESEAYQWTFSSIMITIFFVLFYFIFESTMIQYQSHYISSLVISEEYPVLSMPVVSDKHLLHLYDSSSAGIRGKFEH